MKRFTDFVADFTKWKSNNGININSENSCKYIWMLPQDACEIWKTELDDYKDMLSVDEYNRYISIFSTEGELLGIHCSVYTNSTKAELYELTEEEKLFTIPNILVTKEVNLTNGNTININGHNVQLHAVIKYHSIEMNPGKYVDGKLTLRHGGIFSEDYLNQIEDYSDITGTIDYSTGKLRVIRHHAGNEEKFIRYRQMLLSLIASVNSGTGNTISTGTVTDYNYLTLTGTFTKIGTPVNKIYEFEAEGETVLYSQEYNLEAAADFINENNKFVKKYIENYDFELGMRTS